MGTDWWYKIRRGFLCSASVHMSFFHLFPTFSSFSRQTDIHGCSWSISKALGISKQWQLQVHCYFLSTEGPRMTTFVRGTKAVVYWCLLPSWPRDFLMAQEEAELFPAEIEASTEPKRCKPPWHHDLNTATECSKCVKPVCKADNIVDSCIWRKSALLFHKILLRRSPGTWDWRRPRLNVLKIAERRYKHGLKHSRSSTIPGNHGTFWHAKDTCCGDFAGVHLRDKEGAHVKDYLNQTSDIIKLPIQTNSNHLTPSADLGQSKRTSCTIPWKWRAASGVSVFSIFRYIWPNVFHEMERKTTVTPRKHDLDQGSLEARLCWKYESIPWC